MTMHILVLRRRSTGARVLPGDVIETHSGQRYTFQRMTDAAGVILAAPYGSFPSRPRRIRGFDDLEISALDIPTRSAPEHRCSCVACGWEWTEEEPPAICPECHSRNVVELA